MHFSILKIRFSSPWLALVLIALTAVVIYSNSYRCPFVFDDKPGIEENIKIRTLTNYLSVGDLLKSRGIVNLTFALNYKFGKLDVFGYHLINVLIHIINGFLAYFLALTIFRQLYLPNVREADSSAREGLKIQAERLKLKGKRGKAPDGSSQFSIFNSNDVLWAED